MLTQHEKRKTLVFMLYLSGFYEKEEIPSQIDLYLSEELKVSKDNASGDEIGGSDNSDEIKWLKDRFYRINEKIGLIDPMIAAVSDGWKLNRMGKTDLAILRIAVYELFYDDSIPAAVAIDEAVKLAGEYGGESSSPVFINGILGKLERNRTINEQ